MWYSIIYIFLLSALIVGFISGSSRDWNSPNPTVFNIGGVLSSNDSEKYFKETIDVST